MSDWAYVHQLSEVAAGAAERAKAAGAGSAALNLYAQAARKEEEALALCKQHQPRTYSVTAVSAVALHVKAGQRRQARELAEAVLKDEAPMGLMDFAKLQLQDIVDGLA